MLDLVNAYLSSHEFMPHGHCFLWRPDVLWLRVGADAAIASAYFSIPLALIYLVRRRKDLAFGKVFVLFAVFILGCGATHIMDIVTVWQPIYQLENFVKILTALASVATAITLWRL